MSLLTNNEIKSLISSNTVTEDIKIALIKRYIYDLKGIEINVAYTYSPTDRMLMHQAFVRAKQYFTESL